MFSKLLVIKLAQLYTLKNNRNKICVKDNISCDRNVPKKQAGQRDGKLLRTKEGMLKILKTKQGGRGIYMKLKVSPFSLILSYIFFSRLFLDYEHSFIIFPKFFLGYEYLWFKGNKKI